MPYKSFESLLEKFPYFLDKNEGSNFNKSEKVFNEEFKKVYNNLYDVYLGAKLRKHLLIWKEQVEPYFYNMYFVAEFPHLKSVTISMIYEEEVVQDIVLDDGSVQTITNMQEMTDVIYTESYLYDDFVNHFEYLYSGKSETIIPAERFIINIETFDEYTACKGFPENNIPLGNEFDHDETLDYWGEFFNVPRRQYQNVAESEYANTYPTYENQPTEDDYHYMQRLLYYATHLNDTPLPVLEIYKLFSLHSTLLNRERLLCKMTDTSRHSVDGIYNRDWIPQTWEHKDQWCNGKEENLFLFVNVNNTQPIQGQKFKFDFKILNSLGKEVYNTDNYNLIEESVIDESETPFLIVPFINGEMIQDLDLKSNQVWTLSTADINEEDTIFVFKAFRNNEEIQQDLLEHGGLFEIEDGDLVSDEILITVKGCNDANFYVSIDGDDNNNGTSKETAFLTVDKALSMVEGEKNIISLLEGEHPLIKTTDITQDTIILSCPSFNVSINSENPTFFRINPDVQLTLQNINLNYKCCGMYADYDVFINNNNLNYPLNVQVNRKYCLIETNLTINVPEMIIQNEYSITGKLSMGTVDNLESETTSFNNVTCTKNTTVTKNDKPTNVAGEIVQLYIDNQLFDEFEVSEDGNYSFNITPSVAESNNYQVKHLTSSNFCKSESNNVSRVVDKGTITIDSNYLFEEGIGNTIEIPFSIKTNTPKMGNYPITVKFLDNDNQQISQTSLNIEDGQASGLFTYSSENVLTEVFKIEIEETPEYYGVSKDIEIKILDIVYEVVDDPTISKGDITVHDTLPEELTDYSEEDIILVVNDSVEDKVYLIDDELESPENPNEDDIILINDSEDYNVQIKDKEE